MAPGQGLQELFSSYSFGILRRHEARENMLRISPAEVQEGVTLLGEAHLFQKSTHACGFTNVVLRVEIAGRKSWLDSAV